MVVLEVFFFEERFGIEVKFVEESEWYLWVRFGLRKI